MKHEMNPAELFANIVNSGEVFEFVSFTKDDTTIIGVIDPKTGIPFPFCKLLKQEEFEEFMKVLQQKPH